MRETTTITRRVIMSKVKTRPNQRHQNITPSRPYTPERKAVPELFGRISPPRVASTVPAPWWSDWRGLALASILILIMICAVFFATRSSGEQRRAPARVRQEILKPPPEINIRPMGFSSSSRSSSGEMGPGHAAGSAGNPGLLSDRAGGDTISARKRRAGESTTSEDNEFGLASFEPNRKLVLPSDIAGNCNIGKDGINDLSSCLALKGARVDR